MHGCGVDPEALAVAPGDSIEWNAIPRQDVAHHIETINRYGDADDGATRRNCEVAAWTQFRLPAMIKLRGWS